jgi:hypothetical protein
VATPPKMTVTRTSSVAYLVQHPNTDLRVTIVRLP